MYTKTFISKQLSYLHENNYFFFVDCRVEGLEDSWEGVLGGWGECGCVVDAWEVGLFDMLVLTGLSTGVWDSVGVEPLARDAVRSRARIFSKACLRSVSAWMALSSAACARSSVSLWTDVSKENQKHSYPQFKMTTKFYLKYWAFLLSPIIPPFLLLSGTHTDHEENSHVSWEYKLRDLQTTLC